MLYWNIELQTLNFKNSNFYFFISSDPSADDSLAIHPLSSSRLDICQVRDITIYSFYSDQRHIQGGGATWAYPFPLDHFQGFSGLNLSWAHLSYKKNWAIPGQIPVYAPDRKYRKENGGMNVCFASYFNWYISKMFRADNFRMRYP